MLRIRCLFISIFIFFQHAVNAQEFKPIQADIDEFQSLSSPAFTILGVTPSSIAKPLSPKEFRATLLSAVSQSNSTLPNNLAIEFSPYWWKSRDATFEQVYIDDNPLFNIKQSASFSIASSSKGSTPDTQSTDLAIGARFTIKQGNASKKTLLASTSVDEKTTSLNEAKFNHKICRDFIEGIDTSEAADRECQKLVTKETANLVKSINEFNTSSFKRVGFHLDLALAAVYAFPGNSTSEREYSKGGIWLTSSFTENNNRKGAIQYLGILRYLQDKSGEDGTDNTFDIGARAVLTLEEQPIAFSIEYVNRTKSESRDSERYSAVLEYRFSEKISFIASAGKNFRDESATDDLFVLGSVNFNVGNGPQITK